MPSSAADPSAPPVFAAREITKIYRMGEVEVQALRGVSLELRESEFVVLLGPSGSGKSTLLHLVGCLDRPDSGEILLGDLKVSHMATGALAAVRRDRLGFVFQSFNLVPVLTARENVEYPVLLTSLGAAYRRPHELSGGERQRVAIARALVNRPALVLADEPTANLDSATGGTVLDLMEDLRDELGVAFLFASHDPSLIARMDRVIHMKDGAACA
jgi:putative ABC transport system ATP-binding protein